MLERFDQLRGLTIDDAFVLADEVQNASTTQAHSPSALYLDPLTLALTLIPTLNLTLTLALTATLTF